MAKQQSTEQNKTEKKKFDAEVGKVLQLMIHSLYTNKEIFMRELISNAADACDKLRYLSLTNPELIKDNSELKIIIKIDKEAKQISIRDTGIGMNKKDLMENLGTVARSGTQNFMEKLSGDAKKDSMLIGQFGVGFYSSFMIADGVKVISKKAGEERAHIWESDGLDDYTISEYAAHFSRGTEVILHVKEAEDSYVDHYRLKHIVKSYSDHINIPIFFVDDSGNEIQANSSSALWTRAKAEITEDEYAEFYKTVAHSADKPWITIHNKNEGAVEYTNLLFIHTNKTFDLFHPDRKRRVKLYIRRVFISDENIDLIPSYLRFVRGVVDSEDLPLNISRETLQHNPTLEKIKTSITNRVLGELKKKKNDSSEEYQNFWTNFGGALKEGLCEASSDHEKLLEVCIFRSAIHDRMISLDEYIKSCKEGQKTIYYLSGEDPAKLKNSPQIEGLLKQNIDVLLFTDTVDDFWVNVNNNYKDYEFKSSTRSDIDLENKDQADQTLGSEDANKGENYEKLTAYFKEILGDLVKDVKISKKLTLSPACLGVDSGNMDIRMERFLIEQKQLAKSSAKILELNPKHKIIEKINANVCEAAKATEDDSKLVSLIFDQACIMEGEPIADAAKFAQNLDNFLQRILDIPESKIQ